MNYFTHNTSYINSNGTSLQGHITAGVYEISTAFGAPMADGFDPTRIDAQWQVRFDNGIVATVYNWKNGHAWLGPNGTPLEEISSWNVGGSDSSAVALVENAIKQMKRIDHVGRCIKLPDRPVQA